MKPVSRTAGTTRAAVRPDRHDRLGQDDPPAGDRLDHQVDGRAVLDLRADDRGADDERDERHHEAHDQRVEHAIRVRPPTADADEQGDQDRQPREQDEQDGPAPAEHAPQRDVDERHDDGHRRTR